MRMLKTTLWSTAVLAAYAAILGMSIAVAVGAGATPGGGAAPGPGAAVAAATNAVPTAGADANAGPPETAPATNAPVPGARAAAARPQAVRPAAPAEAAQAWLAETVTRDSLKSWLDAHYTALPAGTRASIAQAVVREASQRGVDPWLVVSVIKVESDFNPDEVGSSGEIGLMQVLPGTARLVARNVFGIDGFDPALLFDPDWNIRIAVAYLADRLRAYRGDAAMALTSYNAGDGVTRPNAYARAVLGWYARIAPRSTTTP